MPQRNTTHPRLLTAAAICQSLFVFVFVIGLNLEPNLAQAFDPPVDQQGPLTVGIDGPARIINKESPFYVSVNIKNSANQSVNGKLRLSGIDQWKCNPADAVSFAVDAESESTIRFQVTPDRGTYRALYPLHARAEFQWQNRQYTAHPILIVYADVQPAPPAATVRKWEPLVIENDLGRNPGIRTAQDHGKRFLA